jgi:hypothetical protein
MTPGCRFAGLRGSPRPKFGARRLRFGLGGGNLTHNPATGEDVAIDPTDEPAAPPIFSIGHGGRTLDDLIRLLAAHAVADVRSRPYSRHQPEFNREPLAAALQRHGLRYLFLGEQLGGRPDDPDCYRDGKVDYERCRDRPAFRDGIARLRQAREQRRRVALLCSEGKPEECHRSKLIGQALADEGIAVAHLDEAGRLLTQQQVIDRLTGGQRTLFGDVPAAAASRRRYRPRPGEGGDGG